MRYPMYRPRRMRRNEKLRLMARETVLNINDLISPFFVVPGESIRNAVTSMPGVFQLSVDELIKDLRDFMDLKIPAIMLFGIPEHKDERGSEAYAKLGIIQRAVQAVKDAFPDLIVITDACLCEYTNHGHCGILKNGEVDNDATLDVLARIALSHVRAGADIIAPSDMMDGRVGFIRNALDSNGYSHIPIMVYSAKYCSSFYGPFREAAHSAPQFGDRRSYQMDPANSDEALREVALDIEEGADIVMVKPALAYLDIVRRVKDEFGYPVAAYCVSGEYAMIKAAALNGWLDEKEVVLETLTAIRRAGADMIITYFAVDVAKWLQER